MGKRDRLVRLSTSWGERTFQTGRVAVALGGAALRRATRRGDDALFGDALVDRLDAMKGLALKVGQMASYLDGVLPPASARRLRRLQQDARPMAWEQIRPVVERALGAPVLDLFERFDPEPVAAASIGQVHRARFEGQEVAVKIQYPGVADTLAVDLGNLARLGLLARLGMPDAPALVEELRSRFQEECDYRLEACRTELGARLLSPLAGVFAPHPHRRRCASPVLTTTWIEGRRFDAFLEASSQEQRDRAGAAIFRAVFTALFGHGLLYADPHPGNFLFTPEGVAIIDWGCVRLYDESFIEAWKALARVVLEERRADLPEATAQAGFWVPGTPFDFDAHWAMMRYLYRPFLVPGFRYTPDYAAESWERIITGNPNLRAARMPGPWAFANRLQWGLNALLGALQAQAPWGDLFREALERPYRPAVVPAWDALP